jgi:hypothetical protein
MLEEVVAYAQAQWGRNLAFGIEEAVRSHPHRGPFTVVLALDGYLLLLGFFSYWVADVTGTARIGVGRRLADEWAAAAGCCVEVVPQPRGFNDDNKMHFLIYPKGALVVEDNGVGSI